MAFRIGSILDPGNIFGFQQPEGNVYGTKPKPVAVPTAEQILSDASLANLAAAPNVRKLAGEQNTFNLDQALAQFERAAPGVYPKLLENIGASARGELSPDVINQIARQTAARGVERGTSGSQFDEFQNLRNLGLTSLSEQQRGQNNFQSLMAGTIPKPYDTSASFLKATYDPYAVFQNDLYNAKVQAAPNPEAAGTAAADAARQTAILGAYSGGSGYAQRYQNPWDNKPVPTEPYNPNSGIGGSEGGGNIGQSFSGASPWTGSYGETGGVGAFNF